MSKKKEKKKTAAEKRNYAKQSLANDVEKSMKRYLKDLNGHTPNQLYDFFLQEVEKKRSNCADFFSRERA